MTYDSYEGSTAEGRPYYLYLFSEGDNTVSPSTLMQWRFTGSARDWTSPAGAADASGSEQTWTAKAVAHGTITQSGDPRRVDLNVTFPISDTFARRYLGVGRQQVTTMTIYRGHEQVPGETVAHWKGRIVSARTEGEQIILRCESVFTSMRREGIRAKYQRICRHPLYAGGCRLDIEDFFVSGTATAYSGFTVTVGAASAQDDGWYKGGVLRFGVLLGFIVRHVGSTLTLSAPIPDLQTEIDGSGSASVEIAPGCNLARDTCNDKFDNLLNYGGFPDIPGRNPFGGQSLI